MLKNKILLSAIFMGLSLTPVFAEELSDIEFPKPPAYRVGISAVPENQYIEAVKEKEFIKLDNQVARLGDSDRPDGADVSYSDLDIKRLSREIAQELECEENDMVADLTLLWQGAATQSDTINFALYKLANPDADKPDKNSLKKVLTSIASLTSFVGAGIGNPIIAGSSLIGGNILGIMSQDTKALNYKYTKVTDADMIILIRKIEDLQQTAVNLYYDYMCAKKQLAMITKLVEERAKKVQLAQRNNVRREILVINDAYYRSALDRQRAAKTEFFAKRAALEQFVGNETFVQFENELSARENGAKTAYAPSENVKADVATPIYSTTNNSQSQNYDENFSADKNKKSELKDYNSLDFEDGKKSDNKSIENFANTDMPFPQLRGLEDGDKIALGGQEKFNIVDGSTQNKIEKSLKKSRNSNKNNDKSASKQRSKKAEPIIQKKSNTTAQTKQVKETKNTNQTKTKAKTKDKNTVKKENTTTQVQTPKIKHDKYSTKGFIFLHNNEHHQSDVPGQARRQRREAKKNGTFEQNVSQTTKAPAKNETKTNNNFLPLDEIRAPELKTNGYSIYDSED